MWTCWMLHLLRNSQCVSSTVVTVDICVKEIIQKIPCRSHLTCVADKMSTCLKYTAHILFYILTVPLCPEKKTCPKPLWLCNEKTLNIQNAGFHISRCDLMLLYLTYAHVKVAHNSSTMKNWEPQGGFTFKYDSELPRMSACVECDATQFVPF